MSRSTEPYKSILDDEPNLCAICRMEGLIESASWVKSKRDGLRLVIGMVVTDATKQKGT